ncbi:formyltransferase [Roseateles chitosanitabidus]|uniref:formyltransferase n=1 Tax=Roseateles chitosanitabidus TaxID=65048 RepID=UPI000831AC17|nr:formyltransferase [Roseateles chitosanitabidus]
MRAVVFAYSNVGDRCLRVLQAGGVDVALVVTHRDHPGEKLWFARVADTADELGIPRLYGDDPQDPALAEAVAAAKPDVIFSFYFRSMLPASLLSLAPGGAYNMHGSLLPKFRGRAPTNWAVLHGATETGATLHLMVDKPDAGDIVDQQAVPILPRDDARQVFDKVCVAAEITLWRVLPALIAGRPPRRANPLADGSYYGGRKPEDGRIHWDRPAVEIDRLVRAVAPPYPGAFVEIDGRRLIVARARPWVDAPLPHDTTPGLRLIDGEPAAICGDGQALRVLEVIELGEPLDAEALRALCAGAAR